MKILTILGSVLGIFTGNGTVTNEQAYQQIIAERDLQIKRMRYTIWILITAAASLGLILIFRKKK